ncbi:MAG: glycine oxidase ThiO [Actinomycetota bacterium]
MAEIYDCIIAGAGIIGLSTAWRVAQLGCSVLVVDSAPKRGASWVAAGMLAPVTEAAFGEEKLLSLSLLSASLYPAFLNELTGATGMNLDSGVAGTLFVALDRDQAEALKRLFEFQTSLGLATQWLGASRCREMEPSLHPSAQAAILAAEDKAVDPRLLLEALAKALAGCDGEVRYGSRVVAMSGGDNPAVDLEGGDHIRARSIVLSAGCWSGTIAGVPEEVTKAIRPVKGQIVRLRSRAGEPRLLSHVIRTEEVYLVSRPSGEIAVGATVEEKGYDRSLTAGSILELLKSADEVAPGIREMEFFEASAGLRPGTPDNAPILGPTSVKGVIAATGHFRNGVLLAPVTAAAIATLVAKGDTPPEIDGFSSARFT